MQLIPFDPAKGGTTKNFCLANVCKGYGIPNLYPSAWEAWLHTQQHTEPIPSGLDVPVFFSYTATIDGITKNWGHIGVRLKDGRFWSDGIFYPSIKKYEISHLPRYVGWGESINNRQILGVNMQVPIDPKLVSEHYSNYTNGHVQLTPQDPACQGRSEYADGSGGEFWRGLNNQQMSIIQALDKEIADLKANSGFVKVTDLYRKV